MTDVVDESLDLLSALDKRVTAVVSELDDLRKKNRSLVTKVNRLERKVRERSDAAGKEWAKERTQIRERVEGLAENLEGLLAED